MATATPARTRPTILPARGRLALLREPQVRANTYAVCTTTPTQVAREKSLDGSIVFITNTSSNGEAVHVDDIKGGRYVLDGTVTKFHRTKKAEKAAWAAEAKKTLKTLPFGSGKDKYHGNDPEVFVLDGKGNLVPAFDFLPSKHEAVETQILPTVNHLTRGNYKLTRKMFWDGFQAEFTTPPSVCFGWGADYIREGLLGISQAAKKVCPTAAPTWKPVVEIPKEMLEASPRECVELGCDPSMNAYFDGPNPTLAQLEPCNLPIRFAGFHIHFGIGQKDTKHYKAIVKLCDAIAGLASVCLFRGMEDVRRREYYGLAGEYRTPPHGLEWRTLSSCVLASPYTYHLMSDLSRAACQMYLWHLHHFWVADEKQVMEAINKLDVDLAWKILTKDNGDVFTALLRSLYPCSCDGTCPVKKVLKFLEKGAKATINTDITSAWKLNGNWLTHSDNTMATIYGLKL